jgi:hypothetical protein
MPRSRVTGLIVALLVALTVASAQAEEPDLRARLAAGQMGDDRVLSAADLAGLKCGAVTLTGLNWIAANLSGAAFSATRLGGGTMDDAVLRGARFVDCDLSGVSCRRADAAGAQFVRSRLGGVSFAAGSLLGARFDANLYAPTGGRHLAALAAALNSLGGADGAASGAYSEAFIAGLAGDAFGFVYDTTDAGREPTLPFMQSPLRAAADCLGAEIKSSWDTSGTAAADTLIRAVRAARPCLLPLSLAGGVMSGSDFQGAFWALAQGIKEEGKGRTVILMVPPFGQREMPLADLLAAWEGPWPTLEAAGRSAAQARFPLFILSPGAIPETTAGAVTAALRHAAAIITDRRTYGTQTPGAAGLQRLADDLKRASQSPALDAARALAPWDGAPRIILASAREAAAAFLDEAGLSLSDAGRAAAARAADLLRSEARMLTEALPAISALPSDTPEQWQARLATASEVMSEIAGTERAAAAALADAR